VFLEDGHKKPVFFKGKTFFRHIISIIMNELEKIRPVIEKKMGTMSIELIDIQFIRAGTHSILRIYIDKNGGITIDDCEKVSNEVSILLDVEGFYNHPYTLEVSSPGLDRPLITEKDYKRVIGKTVKVTLKNTAMKKNTSIKGKLLECNDGILTLLVNDEKGNIPLSDIHKGKIEIEFK